MAILILSGHMGHQVVQCSFDHPESPHIGFGGSGMKTVATRAINVYSRWVGAAWFIFSRYMALGATSINIWT